MSTLIPVWQTSGNEFIASFSFDFSLAASYTINNTGTFQGDYIQAKSLSFTASVGNNVGLTIDGKTYTIYPGTLVELNLGKSDITFTGTNPDVLNVTLSSVNVIERIIPFYRGNVLPNGVSSKQYDSLVIDAVLGGIYTWDAANVAPFNIGDVRNYIKVLNANALRTHLMFCCALAKEAGNAEPAFSMLWRNGTYTKTGILNYGSAFFNSPLMLDDLWIALNYNNGPSSTGNFSSGFISVEEYSS